MSDKKDLIIFLDEDNAKKDLFVEIIELKEGFITFKNASNSIITIPMGRLLKIKKRSGEGEE